MTQTTEMFEKDFTNLSTCDATKVLVLLKHSRHVRILKLSIHCLIFFSLAVNVLICLNVLCLRKSHSIWRCKLFSCLQLPCCL